MYNYLRGVERQCKDTVGKLKAMYLMPFLDYDELQVEVRAGELHTFPSTTVFLFDIEAEYSQNSELNNGTTSWVQQLSFQLTSAYNDMNPEVFTRTNFRAIGLTNNGHYVLFGLMGGLKAELNNTSGASKSDFNGLAITLQGTEEQAAVLTDMTPFQPFLSNGGFDYNFNFNL